MEQAARPGGQDRKGEPWTQCRKGAGVKDDKEEVVGLGPV